MIPECPFCENILKPVGFKEGMVEVACECGNLPRAYIAIDTTVIWHGGVQYSSLEALADQMRMENNIDYAVEKLDEIIVDAKYLTKKGLTQIASDIKERLSNPVATAIALLQEAGYAVATTAMDNEVLAELSGSEIEILSNHFQGKRTDSRLYLTLAHLEEDFEELPDGVKPIVKKILDSVPQKSGRPELVLIETE